MRAGFKLQDKCGFAAGDANLSRYVQNGPTNFTDPAGLAGRNVSGVQRRGDERVSYWYNEGDFIDTATRRKGKVEVKAGFFNWDISSTAQ